LLSFSVCAMLCASCVKPAQVIPDQTILHQLAEDCDAVILVKTSAGKFEKQKARLQAGGYYGSQQLVEGSK